MPSVEERIQTLHQAIGRGRPYANGLLDAKRIVSDPTPNYAEAHKLVDGVRKLYDMKNRRTLREAPAGNKERQSIEQHLESFEMILKILKRKAEEQARKPKPESAPAQVPTAKSTPEPAVEPKRNRAISLEVENILSALQTVNEAVISLRFVVLDKPVGQSGAHRGKVTEMRAAFRDNGPHEARERAAAMLRDLDQNFKVWQRQAAALKARMESGTEEFLQRDKDKLRQELAMVPNQLGIADRHIRRLINLLDVLLSKKRGREAAVNRSTTQSERCGREI